MTRLTDVLSVFLSSPLREVFCHILQLVLLFFSKVPSFARRSSVPTGFEESSHEAEPKCEPVQVERPQPQQYELNSKKLHQYQPSSPDVPGDHPPFGKKKFLYQLNSKKHHHYEPDVNLYDAQASRLKEVVKAQEPAGKPSNPGWNLPSALQQKWTRNKNTGCLSKVKEVAVEVRKPPVPVKEAESEQALKPDPKDASLPVSMSNKMKIIKNKNKNGHIVIVVSKYMDGNKVPGAKGKHGESSGVEKSQNAKRSEGNAACTTKVSDYPENGIPKEICSGSSPPGAELPMKCRQKDRQFSKPSPSTAEEYNTEVARGQADLPEDLPLQLTASSPMTSWSADTNIPTPTAVDQIRIPTFPNDRKRKLSDPVDDRCASKTYLTSRSLSVPDSAVAPPQDKPMDLHFRGSRQAGASQAVEPGGQDEPMDLSFPKTKGPSPQPEAKAEVASPPAVTGDAPKLTEKPTSAPAKKVSPFMGNLIITDITTNSLTVTFKEYVSF